MCLHFMALVRVFDCSCSLRFRSFFISQTFAKLKDMVKLESAINEALRLSSASIIVREVMNDFTLKMQNGDQFHVKHGQKVAMYVCPQLLGHAACVVCRACRVVFVKHDRALTPTQVPIHYP